MEKVKKMRYEHNGNINKETENLKRNQKEILDLKTAIIKMKNFALAGVAQWIECWPANRKVTGSIPGQGTCLGCGPGPWLRA